MQDSLPSYSKFIFSNFKKNIHNNYEYEIIIGSVSSISKVSFIKKLKKKTIKNSKVSYYQIKDFRLNSFVSHFDDKEQSSWSEHKKFKSFHISIYHFKTPLIKYTKS